MRLQSLTAVNIVKKPEIQVGSVSCAILRVCEEVSRRLSSLARQDPGPYTSSKITSNHDTLRLIMAQAVSSIA